MIKYSRSSKRSGNAAQRTGGGAPPPIRKTRPKRTVFSYTGEAKKAPSALTAHLRIAIMQIALSAFRFLPHRHQGPVELRPQNQHVGGHVEPDHQHHHRADGPVKQGVVTRWGTSACRCSWRSCGPGCASRRRQWWATLPCSFSTPWPRRICHSPFPIRFIRFPLPSASPPGSRWRDRYEFEAVIHEAGGSGGAYVVFPWNLREEFGAGRVKVRALFDGIPSVTIIVKSRNRHSGK